MMTDSPAMTAYEDQERRAMTEAIRRYGVWNTYVSDADEADCACCDAIPANRAERRAAARRRGRRAQEPTVFCYTTGLFGMGHPELLVFGLPAQTSARLCNGLAHRVLQHDGDLLPGELLDWPDPALRITVEEVPNPGAVLFAANDYYQRPPEFSVAALQLTWADPAGRFPWDEGCSLPATRQPRPETFDARMPS